MLKKYTHKRTNHSVLSNNEGIYTEAGVSYYTWLYPANAEDFAHSNSVNTAIQKVW